MAATLTERLALLEKSDLYPVITPEFCRGRNPEDILRAVLDGGVGMVQLRLKGHEDIEYYNLAESFRKITEAHDALLIIDDRTDIALATGADGVHLGQSDMPVDAARRIAPELIIGASTHDKAEALEAQSRGASYVNIGPIYPTLTKGSVHAIGERAITDISPLLEIPFTVMGGIKEHHIPRLLELGVRRIAMVTAITEADEVTKTVITMRNYWNNINRDV